jgi:hypothetical protein
MYIFINSANDANEAMEICKNVNANAISDDDTKHSAAVQFSWRPPQSVSMLVLNGLSLICKIIVKFYESHVNKHIKVFSQ